MRTNLLSKPTHPNRPADYYYQHRGVSHIQKAGMPKKESSLKNNSRLFCYAQHVAQELHIYA
jgi:hypothetical protein